MNKNVIIAILAIITIASLSYAAMPKSDIVELTPIQAKDRVEQFVNGSLFPEGVSATFGDVTSENGMYKVPINMPDGTTLESYVSKDGQLFFPEAINIDEMTKQIQEMNSQQPQATDDGELEIEVLTEGTGEQVVEVGDNLTVDYTGTLEDGTVFDSSVEKGVPFNFTVGQGQVIKGWDEGLIGMKVGEERKLTIPPSMGYGANSNGAIPANSTLIFTVKLISINQ